MSRVRNCARQDRGREVTPASQLRCVRKPPCPPWQQMCAMQAIAQQVTALRLAQAAALSGGVLMRLLVGGPPPELGKAPSARTPIHSLLNLTQRLVVQTRCELQRPVTPVLLSRPSAQCVSRGRRRCSGNNVTTGRHALAISLLSSCPRAYQAVSSVGHPVLSGVGQPQFELPHEARFSVSLCGDARSKQKGLTPQPREGPVLSAGHLFLPSPSFRFSLNPLYPSCAVMKSAIFADPLFKVQLPWNVATLPNDNSITTPACLTRKTLRTTSALTRTADFYNITNQDGQGSIPTNIACSASTPKPVL